MVARLGTFALVAFALFAATAAKAADYSLPPPPPPVMVQPAPQLASGWYLRGNVGVGVNGAYELDYLKNPLNTNDFKIENNTIGDTFFIGGGAGYEWNNWLRFDATVEYRAKSRVYAFGSYTQGGGTFLDTYEGNLSSWVFLANGYVDLGTWNCFTPFIGAGIGGAYNTMHDLTDVGIPSTGRGFGRNPSEWNLAWALYAGVAYDVSKNLKVELAYRYLNYGSITDTIDCVGGCHPDSYKFGNLTSNDIMLGLRWTCCDVAPPPPPVVYAPPPLRSRG